MRRLSKGLGAALALVGLWATAAFAQTTVITVTTLMDTAEPPFNGAGFCGTGTVANLPGADGKVSLREAIIAANHTSGSKIITFDPSLSGGTIHVNNKLGTTEPQTLPWLCGGNITINGDLNGDTVPDITLDGLALPHPNTPGLALGILIFSNMNTVNGLAFTDFGNAGIVILGFNNPQVIGNTTSHNTVTGGNYGIAIQAGGSIAGDLLTIGHVANTVVMENTVSGLLAGMWVLTGDGPGSTIDGTTISKNQVKNNAGFGILVSANYSSAGSNTSITNTTITDNEVFSSAGTGIFADTFAGQKNSITGLVIDHNRVHDNDLGAISLISGNCGGMLNTMAATVSRNTLTGNGPSDVSSITALGGNNSFCSSSPAVAAQNQLTVTITQNTLREELGTGIGVIGGQVGADQNLVTATVTDNTVFCSGLSGIAIIGGTGTFRTFSGPTDKNTVMATVSGNQITNSGADGIALIGGFSGPASMNTVKIQVESNITCGNTETDIGGVGGFLGNTVFSPNAGSGNQVTGTLTTNHAATILVGNGIAGNSATLQQQGNTDCSAIPVLTNVTSQVSVTRGGFRRDTTTGRYVQQMILKNTSSKAITGPVSLVIDGLSKTATLFGATGTTSCATPVSPYVNVNVGADQVLSPGERATVVLQFINPTNVGIAYTTRVLAGPDGR